MKKNNNKKFVRNIILVVVAVAAIAILVAFIGEKDYKYASEWDIDEIAQVSAMDYIRKYDVVEVAENSAKTLDYYKALIKRYIFYPDLYDWEKFDKLNIVYNVAITMDDVVVMDVEELVILSSYAAFYDEQTDAIYLLPGFFDLDEDKRAHAIVHEIVHSLVNNRCDIDDCAIVEGTVEYIAGMVCLMAGYEIPQSYQEAVGAVMMMFEIYGERQTIEAVCNDAIIDLVDSSTKPGMTEILNSALGVAHNGPEIDDIVQAVYVELDVLTHAAKKEGKDINEWLDKIYQMYLTCTKPVELDMKYFRGVLQ